MAIFDFSSAGGRRRRRKEEEGRKVSFFTLLCVRVSNLSCRFTDYYALLDEREGKTTTNWPRVSRFVAAASSSTPQQPKFVRTKPQFFGDLDALSVSLRLNL